MYGPIVFILLIAALVIIWDGHRRLKNARRQFRADASQISDSRDRNEFERIIREARKRGDL